MKKEFKSIYIEGFNKYNEEEIKDEIITYFSYNDEELNNIKEQLEKLNIIIAYESIGYNMCDSSGFILFKNIATKELFELHYGCDCNEGFLGQFELEITSLEYLKSDKFNFYCGGYDSNKTENQKIVKEFLKNLLI